jgi:dihydroxy-acid dehydratase
MKTSTIHEHFRKDYLSNPKDPNAFEGKAVVFDGLEDYLRRIDDPALEIDEHTLLFMRGAGPIGYPGSCKIVNMRPPTYPLKQEARRPVEQWHGAEERCQIPAYC